MKLSDLLLDDWIAVPMEVADLQEALQLLLSRIQGSRPETVESMHARARDLASGSAGEMVRVNADVVLVMASVESLDDLSRDSGRGQRPLPDRPGGG